MRRRRRAALGVATAGVLALLVWWHRSGDGHRLPAALSIAVPVADLSAAFERSAVVEEAASDPVRPGVIRPGEPLRGNGPRTCLVAPPRSRIRFAVGAPPGAALRFAIGVEGVKARPPASGGVAFSVQVDGRRAYRRVVNPAAAHRDRRWFDGRIPLTAETGRPVEIVLETDADRDGLPLAGTPGWSRVRVVRETTRERQPARPSAPNVIVLLVDTLRADRVGCYGAYPSPTPMLDQLAAEGLVFEHAVAQSSWTMASVASLFTGLHPRSHGAVRDRPRGGADDEPGNEFLADEVVTWAEAAARAGITTIAVSSNPLVSRATNLAQGFETVVEFSFDPRERNWVSAATVNRAFLRWLTRNRGLRFVAHLHYMEPHDPYTPPPALRPAAPTGVRPAIAAGWVRDAANRINWHAGPPLPAAEIAHLRALYDGDIRAWDTELAALLGGLAELGVRDSTLLIVTADHGEEFQEHGHLTHGSHLYGESILVPLVVAGPGVPRGRRSDLAQGIDVFPTIAGILGVAAPPALPGRDLLADSRPGAAVSETSRGIAADGSPLRLISVLSANWHLIHAPTLGRFELYDLAQDPAEREDRFGSATEGAALAARLAEWETTAPAPPRADGSDPAFGEKLRALGYVD